MGLHLPLQLRRILRRDGDRLGYTSHFTIYDTDDSRRLMKDVLKDLDIPERALSVRGALAEISRAKDKLTTPEDFEAGAGGRLPPEEGGPGLPGLPAPPGRCRRHGL